MIILVYNQHIFNNLVAETTQKFTIMIRWVLVLLSLYLINMCLDILLREYSDGEKGVLWLMKELSAKYDAYTPFEDDSLIPEIVAMTYPEIGTFFEDHVQGDIPIDYDQYFSKVGLTTAQSLEESGYFFKGNTPYIDVNPDDDSIFLRKGIELSSFFNDLGIRGGDIIVSIDGTQINLDSIRPIIGQSFGWDPDKEINITVSRDGEEIIYEGKVGTPKVKVRTLAEAEGSGPESREIRKSWLKG